MSSIQDMSVPVIPVEVVVKQVTPSLKQDETLTENGAIANSLAVEDIIQQLWLIVDEHDLLSKLSIFDRFINTYQSHINFYKLLETRIKEQIKNKNIRWLNNVFILIIRKRDYRHGGEGHKTFYYTLLFSFLNALINADCLEIAKFYMYVASRLSNYYGCWKDLRKIIKLLQNPEKINIKIDDEHIIKFDKLNIFIDYCIDSYVTQLKDDINNYNNKQKITLCSKFIPTQNTDIKSAKKIARLIFTESKTPDKDYRQIITKLHNYLTIIEPYICGKRLDEFDPHYITGCNKQYYHKQFNNPNENWKVLVDKFDKMNNEILEEVHKINARLQEISIKLAILKIKEILSDDEKVELESLTNEEKELKKKLKEMKIATGAESADLIKLFNMIIYNIQSKHELDATSELIIESIKSKFDEITKLDALCVCDTSGSMSGDPMAAALMLTYLISSTSSDIKFRNKFITFSEYPKWISVKCKDNAVPTFLDFYNAYTRYNICENTNIQATIDLITSSIKESPNFNPKVIFFLTDGQFDEMAYNNTPISCKDYIKQEFEKIGKQPPLCIFWNLRNCNAIEAKASDNGFIMYSGFSQKQLDSIAQGIFTLESEGKQIEQLSTEDMIIQFINSSFKDEIINIMKSYSDNKIFFDKDITDLI